MDELNLSLRLIIAALLAGFIGLNREMGRHSAGLRTHMLVGMGSALFTVLSITAFSGNGGSPDRVAAQIITGIGFLGAGTIIRRADTRVHGLTTAADIWAVAAVGMAAGAGKFILAAVGTLIMLFILGIIGKVERQMAVDKADEKDEPASD